MTLDPHPPRPFAPPAPAWQSAIAAALSLTIVMGIGRFGYTPILPSMQQSAGLDPASAGLLASINFTGYMLGALICTALAHSRSRLQIYRASLVLGIVTTVAMGLSADYLVWSILRFLQGLAAAGVLLMGVPLTMETLARTGKNHLLGIVFGGVGIGIALSGLVVTWIDPLAGWRGDWLWLGLIAALLGIPAWLWQRGGAAENGAAHAETGRLRLQAPELFLLAGYLIEGIGYAITATFLVVLLKSMPGLGGIGLYAWVVVGLASAPSTVLWGLATRRIGQAPALLLACLLQAFGTALPVFLPLPVPALVAAALFGATFTGIVALAFGFAREMAPGATGRMIGLLTIGYSIGQVLGPFGAGLMIAGGRSFALPLLAAAGAALLSALLIALAWGAESRRQAAPRPQPGDSPSRAG